MKSVIYGVDVGSPSAGLAWARLENAVGANPTGSKDFALLAKRIVNDLQSGAAVAIGFEAPGFIPVPHDVTLLGRARKGEVRDRISRPWSYGPGAYVATMVIQLGAWLLREVKKRFDKDVSVTFDPHTWPDKSKLLLWEAFVSGPGHAREKNEHGVSEHIQDAATAAKAFQLWCASTEREEAAVSSDSRISTLGAIALWAGWTTDIAVLSQEPFVLWPKDPLGNDVTLDPEFTKARAASTESETTSIEDLEEISEDMLAATISVTCGDTHSFWKSHQTSAQLENFELLRALTGASPSKARQCEVSFDSGATWQALVLRNIGENQISWRRYNARASTDSKIEALVRT